MRFDNSGRLTVKNCHAHSCKRCPKNLGQIAALVECIYTQLQQGVIYARIVIQEMVEMETDAAMRWKGYTLRGTLARRSQNLEPMESSVVVWSSGVEIISHLRFLMKE
ncbi:hypothetical protein U0070_006071 [Myodes glareolus]|uniref:Uncharacterized protein n=1 Tax=Myodes glareolus TaxID=447135 RepID=A0AAW0IB21_MYOGA